MSARTLLWGTSRTRSVCLSEQVQDIAASAADMFAHEGRSDTGWVRFDRFCNSILLVGHSEGGGGDDGEKNGAVVIVLAMGSVVQAVTTMHGSTISTRTNCAQRRGERIRTSSEVLFRVTRTPHFVLSIFPKGERLCANE